MTFQTVIILGVPRSGTTLLRGLLGSYPEVADFPETPWITGCYLGHDSIRTLKKRLLSEEFGIWTAYTGLLPEAVDRAIDGFFEGLFGDWLKEHKKRVLVLKTPDDVLYLDDLVGIFPHARYVHIVRDPRDVTLSTLKKFGVLNGYGAATPHICLRRWLDFEQRIRARFEGASNYTCVRYETLVQSPQETLQGLAGFLGLKHAPLTIVPNQKNLSASEAGSRDVLATGGVERNVARFRSQPLTVEQRLVFNAWNQTFESYGYTPVTFEVGVLAGLRVRVWQAARMLRKQVLSRLWRALPMRLRRARKDA